MRVIIAGSRWIKDYDYLLEAIEASGFKITAVICGGAKGPDTLGDKWAQSQIPPVTVEYHIPNWNLGRKAGIIRNTQMGKVADALIAIWDGESAGTAHMIKEMERRDRPVFVLKVPPRIKEPFVRKPKPVLCKDIRRGN